MGVGTIGLRGRPRKGRATASAAVDAVSTTGEAIERLGDRAYPIVISDIYIDERDISTLPRHVGLQP